MSNESNVPAVKEKDVIGGIITKMKGEWAKVLPSVCTPERFARVALSCVRKNPKLGYAILTQTGEVSLLSALMRCAELGIEPDGERAYLIPYKDEVQFQLGYKGIAELVMRSGLVTKIHADKVCRNDIFEYDKGDIKQHKIDIFSDRGEVGGYYCIIKFKDGTEKCELMSKSEVDEIRKTSKSADGIPWRNNYHEMAKKTVFKRCAKWLKQSPEVQRAIEIDNEDYIDISAEHVEPKVSKFEQKKANAQLLNLPVKTEDEIVAEAIKDNFAGITVEQFMAHVKRIGYTIEQALAEKEDIISATADWVAEHK